MLLRSRVTIIVVSAILVICSAFSFAIWQRDEQLTGRYHASLVQGQKIAWNKLENATLESLQVGALQLIRRAEWMQAWRNAERETALGLLADSLILERPTWRIDVFDARRRLAYTTSSEVDPAPLLDAGWVARALRGGQKYGTAAGLIQVTRDQYYWVHAEHFGEGTSAGVIAVGVRAALRLPELASSLGGEISIVNLRGRSVAGTHSLNFLAKAERMNVRSDRVWTVAGAEGMIWLAVSLPLTSLDRRSIGALVTLRNVTDRVREDRQFTAILAAAGSVLVSIFLALLYVYLRVALEPLGRAVEVLGELARGNLESSLDDGDELQDDEAGQIGRGVITLRQEMLNLQMLRDERARIREQQERLIREQLRLLAESLDPESRNEIIRKLEVDGASGSVRSENQLAELAEIFSRMSGLVINQQARLLTLLEELRAAMESQTLLVSLQQELNIARRMQSSILPRDPPQASEIELAATMVPAREVGGDFYDYFLVDEAHLAVVVADVSGKGVPAAFFMAISRTLLKSDALFLQSPAQIIAQLNDQLCAENEQMMFVTMFFGILDLHSGVLTYVNAGHNPPVWLPYESPACFLPSGQNPALAVVSDIEYSECRLTLGCGDCLFLYTDGVTEAVDSASNLFGSERLLTVLGSGRGGALDLPATVLRTVRAFEDGCTQADDITCVAIRYIGRK